MSIQYASIILHEYFLLSGNLTSPSNTDWGEIWDRQKVHHKAEKKCPLLGDPSQDENAFGIMTTKCVEYFIEEDDVDECKLGLHDCPENSHCVKVTDDKSFATERGYNCNCHIGFTKDEARCVPLVDECSSGVHGCHRNAFCFDKQVGFGCMCNDGFQGDGFNCEFVDLCQTFTCDLGFMCSNIRSGVDCKDINECDDRPCRDDQMCINAIGSYVCINLQPSTTSAPTESPTTTVLTTTTTTSTTTTTDLQQDRLKFSIHIFNFSGRISNINFKPCKVSSNL